VPATVALHFDVSDARIEVGEHCDDTVCIEEEEPPEELLLLPPPQPRHKSNMLIVQNKAT
jgi:hypothetical protein